MSKSSTKAQNLQFNDHSKGFSLKPFSMKKTGTKLKGFTLKQGK